jgi:ATP-dependent DNA helicase RecQ
LEKRVADYLKASEGDVKKSLQQLAKQKIIHYDPSSDSPRITFTMARQDADELPVDWTKRKERMDLALSRMEAVIRYVSAARSCRMVRLQEYFGEEGAAPCGICDVCITRKKKEHLKTLRDYRQQVLHLLRGKRLTVDELESEIEPNEKELFIDLIRDMVDEGTVVYDEVWRLGAVK